MDLQAGTRLGPYEVIGPLGAGGMGEVYRARDPRLAREVAIKVLPAGVASDPERLKRFEREARSASSLNHPNIVTIYDIGESEGVSFIAMELVGGASLRAHLESKALPVREILRIGTQIAEGLARAHASGIVHRDLKPENVMVTEDGHVKILDFGLAKLIQAEPGEAATAAATVSDATQEGLVLGTVGYMSPEQATGKALDYRSDQFSLGSILYEMATGKRAFLRASKPQTLAAIIQDEPEPIAGLNPKVPAPLRWIVERCLTKEGRNRYASTEDLARDLATVRDRLSEATSASALALRPMPARRRWLIPAALAAALLLALGVMGWRLRSRDYFWTSPLAGARFTRFTDWEGAETDAAISRDGKFVAFIADRAGQLDTWVGQVGGGTFLNLSMGKMARNNTNMGTTRGVGFSGDGAHVWTQVQTQRVGPTELWLTPTIGGAARLLLSKGVEATWSPDGNQIAFFYPPGDAIFVADKNGNNPTQILADKKGFHNHYLNWSPDGRFIYFVRGVPPDDMDVWRIPPSGGEPERLTKHHGRVSHPALLDPRTLVYCARREDGGWGLYEMDVERRIPHAVTSGLEEYTSVSASADGRRLAATVSNPVRNLWTLPITDRVVDEADSSRFDLPSVRASAPRYGPDYILYLSSRGGAQGLWKWKDGSEAELWKGSDGALSFAPAVSADGSQIAFVAHVDGQRRLFVMSSEGMNVHRIGESLDIADVPSWSPDGKWIAAVVREDEGRSRPLVRIPTEGGSPVRLVEGNTSDPVWSPDGRLILYSEGRGGGSILHGVTPDKQPVPLPEIAVPYAGNRFRFMPDGKSAVLLLHRIGQAVVQPAAYHLLDVATGRLRRLTNSRQDFLVKSFDVSPDGKTILFDRYRENADIVLIDLPPR
jgi:Tol biopolymer transport system component